MRTRFAVLLFAFTFSTHAQAQEGHLGASHDKWHQSFYNALQRPDGKGPMAKARVATSPTVVRLPAARSTTTTR